MNNKIYDTIGMITTAFLGSLYMLSTIGKLNASVIFLLTVGLLLGVILPDIDSKHNKLVRCLTTTITVLVMTICTLSLGVAINNKGSIVSASQVLGQYFNLTQMKWLDLFLSQIVNVNGLPAFGLLITFGKLSPHKGFTHKVIGAFLFCSTAFVIFNTPIAIGFTLGYFIHILLDKTVSDGLVFFELFFPLQKYNGQYSLFKVSYSHANK